MPFQIARRGVTRPEPAEVRAWRAAFDRQHCILLPRLLEPRLVEWLRTRASAGPWQTLIHADLDPPAVDLLLRDDVAWGTIATLLNDPVLMSVVADLTGVSGIRANFSRIYRMDPRPEQAPASAHAVHTDTWHGDNDGNRLLTLSINLAAEPFAGGELEIRDAGTGHVLHRVANTGPGDGILFRIADDLQHRVREVTGHVSKVAIAGWFQRGGLAPLLPSC